jgi:protein-tyrosine phosphatase
LAIELGKDNIGPIAKSALNALSQRGVALEEQRYPLSVNEADFDQASHIVALKRDEHWPIMAKKFPRWVAQTEYWQVHDIDQLHPKDALPQIEREVQRLLERLMGT